MSFFEYSERGRPAGPALSRAGLGGDRPRGQPKLSFGWLFLRATRLPFLTATFVPVLLGIAVAAWTNGFSWWLALLTLIGGACIHLGLNVANDVFDTTSGADEANVNPTQFSGGSRVVQYGLLTLRRSRCCRSGSTPRGSAIGLTSARARAGTSSGSAPPARSSASSTRRRRSSSCIAGSARSSSRSASARSWRWAPTSSRRRSSSRAALRLDPGRDPDRARALRERGARPPGRRRGREADPAGAVLSGRVVDGTPPPSRSPFALIVVFALGGWIVRPAIIALAAAPLALPVYRALKSSYDQPYALMPAMGKNIQLHLATGVLLIFGYVIALIADGVLDDPPAFLT